MTPAARLAASIELLDLIERASVPMDRVCGDYFRGRRYIGSKDRASIAERVYDVMRMRARLQWWCARIGLPADSRSFVLVHSVLADQLGAAALSALCDGARHHPLPLTDEEMHAIQSVEGQGVDHPDMDMLTVVECPPEYGPDLMAVFGETMADQMRAMLVPAALDLRVNTLKTDRETVIKSLRADRVAAAPCPYSPVGIRLKGKHYIAQTKAFRKGWIDIQDEGSQILALITGAKPGMQVLDYCAGGGGKTLALAAMMGGKGRIVAMDIDEKRLAKAKPRLTKADVHNVELRPLSDDRHQKWLRRQKNGFDIVLVDAPCTSSGTWRRNPDLRWRRHGPDAQAIQKAQADILSRVGAYVKPGGRLVYATCSLFAEENERQIERFLEADPDFTIVPVDEAWTQVGLTAPCPVQQGPWLRLTPRDHQTDGFFAAIVQKKGDTA